MMKLLVLFMVALIVAIKASYNPDLYLCSVCLTSVDNLRLQNIQSNSLLDGCNAHLPKEYCDLFFGQKDFIVDASSYKSNREVCHAVNLCPMHEDWMDVQAVSDSDLDIRVSKAVGKRDYNQVRISVISNSTLSSSAFTYQSQYKFKWTNKYLSTGLFTITPGITNTIQITDDQSIDVFIPNENDGTRGVIIADPCFQSQWITCAYKDKFTMFNHSIELLNAINLHDDVSFFQILGDNFYDQTGDASSQWFTQLTQQTKSKVFYSVPGNHDFWVNGGPDLRVPADQLGNGFMQFYGQDVLGSFTDEIIPFDFSVDPSKASITNKALPPASNFFFYNKLGNIGFMGYSGAHTYTEHSPLFAEACTWAASADIDVFLILTHWNSEGLGCESDMTAANVYKELIALPECSSVASKMKYFMGHAHCNEVTLSDTGFMVGANGMSDGGCTGQYGIPVVDTTGGSFKVYYFPINELNKFDNYEATLACFKENGVSGCYDLATVWSTIPF